MHVPTFVLSLLALADHWFLALAESSFLASTRSKLATTVASRKHLRAEATHLAGALRSLLGVRAEVTAQQIARARELLGEEAERLASEGVPGARLMREYAFRVPAAVLLVSPLEPAAYEEPGALAAVQGDFDAVEALEPLRQLTTESEETVLSKDGDGRIVTRTRQCKNGHCMQRTELNSDSQKSSASHGTLAASQERLADVVRRMANEMWGVEQSFGHSRLEDLLRDVFAERDMQPGVDAVTDFHHGKLANASALNNGVQQIQSISSSTETVVEDGRMLRRERHCRNGQCSTKVFHSEIAERKPAVDDDTGKHQSVVNHKKKMVDMPL